MRLLEHVRKLRFGDVVMHGVKARRRVVQFGWKYTFEARRVESGPEIPDYLETLGERVARFAGTDADAFSEVLVTEYPPGAGIGWHRDAPPFGKVAGLSLAAECRLRLKPYGERGRASTIEIPLLPRSLYVLSGDARSKWQHQIPPVRHTRYSITFRTLRKKGEVL
ncbi:MAG: alpha-ketoglutarate-dependent dioxygenase AlkB [Acidobacteria bacterium]|nr:MAG: alpha-ketoglutarate-dependent dioxygenase AlkB [Acidobacteriota bacterium]